jgi:hypothetical protein
VTRNVFISYSHQDAQFVNQFAGILNTYDLNVWKDSKDILVGGNILKSVYEGIKNASHFCCIISSASIASAWVEDELSFAKMRQLKDRTLAIVPVLIEAVAIPDYVLPYRCAHLEDQLLTIKSPEFVAVLKAFGTDIAGYPREIITGPERQALLDQCEQLRYEIGEFRGLLLNFQTAYNRYLNAIGNQHDDVVRPSFDGGYARRTRYGSDAVIRHELEGVAGVLRGLKNYARTVLNAFELVEKTRKELDPSNTIHRLRGLLFVNGLITYVAKTIAESSDDPLENWWVGDKLRRWVRELPEAEASVQSAIELLASWGRFDEATPR